MDERPIGWLERVEPGRVWTSEREDFVPWLAAPETLGRLGEAIGIDLEAVARERSVGRFRADLVCRDAASGLPVVIEAQLDKSDHRHLGQILTYAAGLDAGAVVWLAARFHDEHRAALDWLNRPGASPASCFGVEIAAFRAGEASGAGIAARFDTIARPGNWPAAEERPPPRPQPVRGSVSWIGPGRADGGRAGPRRLAIRG